MLGRVPGLRIVWALIALLLADCATVVAQPSLGSPPPTNYRQLVSDGDVATILRGQDRKRTPNTQERSEQSRDTDNSRLRMRPKGPVILSVSSLRKTIATEQGDWFTCLKAVRGGMVTYYGIFFIGTEVVEWRPAVAIDHCEQETYAPLPPPTKKPKKDDDDADDSSPAH